MNGDFSLTPLDPRFPIRLSEPPSVFWELCRERPDRVAVLGEAARARAQAAEEQQRERFVAPVTEPIPLPVLAALPDETQRYGDEFPRHVERDVLTDEGYLYRPPETTRTLDRDMRRTERRHVLHRVRRAITRGSSDEWLA